MRATAIKLMTLIVLAAAPALARAQDAVQINLVESWYERYLGRTAEPGGLIGSATRLAQGTAPILVESSIIGSPEYFNRNGSNEASFIVAVYRDVLGASPTPQQLQLDLARLQQMGCNRDAFALEFLQTRRVAYQPAPIAVAPVVQTYRPAHVHPPRPVVVAPAYRPAYYRPVPYPTPGATIAIRQPGFGLGVNIR